MSQIGPTRSNPYGGAGQAQHPMQAQTPCNILTAWTAQLKHAPSQKLNEWLNELAHGRIPHDPVRGAEAKSVFAELLLEGAFDVFVDLFNANSRLRKALAQAEGRAPFKASLELELPKNWTPDIDALKTAFARIQVEELLVLSPARPGREPASIPEAVCHAAAVLLRGGTTELVVGGELALPNVVADAFKDSQLRSIELRGTPWARVLDQAAKESYGTVVLGLVQCASLKGLHIHDGRLFWLHTVIEKLLTPGGPNLETVGLKMPAPVDVTELLAGLKMPAPVSIQELVAGWEMPAAVDTQALRQIMSVIARFPMLKEVSVSETWSSTIPANRGANKLEAVLAPLTGHPSLTRLNIQGVRDGKCTQENMAVLLKVAEFAVSCSSFTHFAWASAALEESAGNVMRGFESIGGDLDMPEATAALAQILASQFMRLKALTLNGFTLPRGLVQAISSWLAGGNASLRYLDLRSCLMDVASAIALARAIKQNLLHETALLPMRHRDYCLRTPDGLLWGIEKTEEEGYEFIIGRASAAARQLAIATFDGLKDDYEKLHMGMLISSKDVRAPMERNIAAFMQMALQSAPQDGRYVDGGMFASAAKATFETLAQEQRVPTAVHLPRVHRPPLDASDVQSPARQLPQPLSASARSALQHFVSTETTLQDSLTVAVEARDPVRLAELLRDGVVDTGGRAQRLVRELVALGLIDPSFLDVFRRFEPSMTPSLRATTTNTTNTTNTMTTTTTSTTGTLGTATSVHMKPGMESGNQ